jgi:hypothetical protein
VVAVARGGDEIRHLLDSSSGRLLVGLAAAVAALTVIGLFALWPYGWHPAGKPRSGTVPAKVLKVTDAPCVAGNVSGACRSIVVAVEGREVQMGLGLARNAPDVGVGGAVRLLRSGDPTVAPKTDSYVHYEFTEVDRRGAMFWLAVLFAVLAAALLRRRGVLAVVGVAISVAVLLGFLVPAILAGKRALLVAPVAALTVMFVTLLLTNGLGVQTLAAALGISTTLVFTCALAYLAVLRVVHLDGTSDLDALQVKAGSQFLSLKGVILAGMLIGALGVLADTAVTQPLRSCPGDARIPRMASTACTAKHSPSAATTCRRRSIRSCSRTRAPRFRCSRWCGPVSQNRWTQSTPSRAPCPSWRRLSVALHSWRPCRCRPGSPLCCSHGCRSPRWRPATTLMITEPLSGGPSDASSR